MESFFRYISYVDYYKKEERIRNVGFLRWKLHNGEHQIELQLKDVNCSQGKYEIKEKNTGKIIGEIVIDKGIGNFAKKFLFMSASDEMYIETFSGRLYLGDVEGFSVWLNSDEYLSVPIKFEKEKHKIDDKYHNVIEQNIISKEINEKDAKAASENVLIEGIEEKYVEPAVVKEMEHEKNQIAEVIKEIEEEQKINNKENGEQDLIEKEQVIHKKLKIIKPIHEDKWQQLCKEFPNVHPFPNRKIFLSIKPEDFIILQQEYQKLVHNSFLLHGFYNYGHIILGKLTEEEETPIYIGVPGVYYEQEKRAAQMFGFVGFESIEHPVQAGSYGYYMIEVEI